MLALIAIVACGLFVDVDARNGRIFNGKDAKIEDYPYQVSIVSGKDHVCGGSIISKHYVLTAAHCANIVTDIKKLSIRAGSSFYDKGGSLHKVIKFISHEDFDLEKNKSLINDIAIIKVQEPFHYDDTCQPIEMYKRNEEVTPGVTSIVTGFGLVSKTKLADQLQFVDLSIISKKDCKKSFKNLPGGQICALGTNGKDSCTGDSGGPLAVNGRLAGIVSNGAECGSSSPSVYTEVSYYHDWINKHVEL